jgi:TBC1 domain family member 8/9
LEEEPAFNLLSHISERIVPGYFQESLAGIKLDQIVMQSLVETHLPKVAAHLQRYMGGCLLVCFEWFMCFFGRCLPVDIVVRVFDWLLLDESRALFVTALAILSIFEEEILRFEAAPSLIETLKKEMLNVQPEPLFHVSPSNSLSSIALI